MLNLSFGVCFVDDYEQQVNDEDETFSLLEMTIRRHKQDCFDLKKQLSVYVHPSSAIRK